MNSRVHEHVQHLFEVCDLNNELINHYLTYIDYDVQQVVKPLVVVVVVVCVVYEHLFQVEPHWVINFYDDLYLYHTLNDD